MSQNIDRLRREAKTLKRNFAAGNPDARERVEAVFADADALKHTQALHVIAREQGHKSWPQLKFALEVANMDREQRSERLRIALYYGQHWVTKALLEQDPDLPQSSLGLQIALYDKAAVEAALSADPEAATRRIGVRSPILHLCFSQHIHAEPERADNMIAIAELLVSQGADVDDSFPFEQGGEHRLSALYGALGHANNMVLARWLLDHGADPNDNESLYHSTELGHHDGLVMLLKHGAKTDGTNALARAMDFDDLEAARLLLEAGADPNEGALPHPSGQPSLAIPSLHQAARRMCSAEMARLLISHGADGTFAYRGHTAYALARMRGNPAIATVIEDAGQATQLDATEALLAAAADGRVEGKVDPAKLDDETKRMMCRVIGFSGRLDHIKRLQAIGIDPDWTDEMGMTAIHIAGWEGYPEAVEWLLTFDPDLSHENDYGGDLLGTIVHGAEFCPNRSSRDHIGCARLALEKGAPLRRRGIDLCGAEHMTEFLLDWADAHPEQVVGQNPE